MKEGWEYKKIKDIGSVIAGTTPNTNVAEYWDGNLCWISPAELDGSHYLYDSRKKITAAAVKAKSLKLLPEGTVILSSRAPIGKVVINKVPTYCNQGFKCVVCGKEVYNEFLYWWFWGKTDYLNSLGTGATFKEISKKVVEEITIPVPPLSEQQSIVDYLDSAFAKIDAMKANAEKALNEAQALFKASLKEMLEPKEGWIKSTLKDECFKITDGTHQTPKYYESGYIFLSSKNVTSRKIDWDDVKFIDEGQHQMMHKRVAPQVGDILLAKNGTTGVAAMVDRDISFDIYVSLALLRSKGNVTPEYLLAYVNSPIAKEQFNKRLIGMGVPNLHLGEINQVVITYPKDKREQEKMIGKIEEMDSAVDRLQENYDKISQECDALKQAILRQVFE